MAVTGLSSAVPAGVDLAGLLATVAPRDADWSPGVTYVQGQLCVHGGSLFRCTVPHVAGPAFAGGNFEAISGGGSPAVAYVRITTTGATFSPVVELAPGSAGTVTWTVEETGATATGLAPTLSFGSAATRHVQMTVTSGATDLAADVRTFNLGFNHLDDAGTYNMGAGYDHTAQAVSAVSGLTNLTGLVRFAAASTALAGTLDFTGLASLQYIECAYSAVNGVTLTGCSSLVRLCLEQCHVNTTVDLNPVASTLRDFRGANQSGGTLTLATLTNPLAQLYHLCVRDQTVVNLPDPSTRLPVVQELWCWNTGQSGALNVVSSALSSLLAYSNGYTSATITGGGHPADVELQNNSITTTSADALLVAVEAWGTSNGAVNLAGNPGRTSASDSAVAALTGRGWTVTATVSGGGGGSSWSDDFQRADASGFAGVGNGWASAVGGTVAIVSGDLVRSDTGGYAAVYNPAGGALPADYTVTATFSGASIGAYLGVWARRGGDGRGIAAFLNTSATDLAIHDGSGYMSNSIVVTADNAFPAGWTNTGVDHTFALRVTGSLAEVYADGVLVGHGTLAVHVGETGTGVGWVGEGNNRHLRSITVT